MRVLVTGSSGFIGQHVCAALRRDGHTVIGLDILNGDDITKPLAPIHGLDAVIHLAAVAAPRDCDADPARAFSVNVNGTHQVLKMALESGARKVVFASSAHVYDIPPKWLPTDENHPLRLNNTYTTTKILGEQLCDLYWTNHGLSYIALRLYNAYGAGQARGYYIPDQIAKAEKGGFELRGSNVTKDWVYVDDVAGVFVKAVESNFVGALNVGTGVETTLGDIARIIAKAYQVELDTYPISVPTRMQADWRRAKNILGWSPKVSLEEGLSRIIQSSMRTVSKVA